MKNVILIFCLFSGFSYSQNCSQVVYPNMPPNNNHIYTNMTVTDSAGGNYYVCSGVTLTMTYSAGCNYQLEDNATLIIQDHEGDNVVAKGNCTITDYSTTMIVVSMESTSTLSKPNDPFNYVVFNCNPTVFDYSMVGGSSPCSLDVSENEIKTKLLPHPNPVERDGSITINVSSVKAEIYNTSGKLLSSYNTTGKDHIELTGLESGTYLLVVTLNDGNRINSKIVVK